MKRLLSVLLLAALTAGATVEAAAAQSRTSTQNEEAGVIAAAMNYMEGALTADADRMARGVHPELTKVVVSTNRETGRQSLSYNTSTTLVEFVRGAAGRFDDVDKKIEVTVFDIGHDIAAARAVGEPWYDYLLLAKMHGEWRIVNVLWARHDPDRENQTDSEDVRGEVRVTALNYIEGAYSGNAERMEQALHPELTKMLLNRDRTTGEPSLYKMGASNLIEGTRAGQGNLDPERRNIEVDIFDISHDMALVKVTSAMYIDLLQIGKVNGEWKIINVL
ncbi:MAG: nuclear transport factor 2 family protein, partial [Gemmatimonadetes bacterium]|nr:nuclear transport factor 2 family protein [Gemmatimonadota bacterium]